VAVDVGTKHEKREVVREGLSPLPNRRKSATPKIQQTLSLPITPVTMTTKTPEVRKSARKTPKKVSSSYITISCYYFDKANSDYVDQVSVFLPDCWLCCYYILVNRNTIQNDGYDQL